jgi:DNA-directed RNA polymerase specialized sigma24 family protein
MSAALQLPVVWGAAGAEAAWIEIRRRREAHAAPAEAKNLPAPDAGLAFYRKHTERMLRRYLYASMLVGRAPEALSDSIGRGWVSSRRVRTFEDAVIFVLDMEKCLGKLNPVDRKILSRIVLQDYTQAETAEMLGLHGRAVHYRFPLALDRLTRLLLDTGLMDLPQH